MTHEPQPASPCVGICLLDPATGYCRGCLRSVAEIAAWYEAGAAEKRAILGRLDQRRRLGKSRMPSAAASRRNS
jgi:predicted Fe-S protein YdhL (DUF1289 family)